MKISNRVKRNILGILMTLGILLIAVSVGNVIENPSSGKAWFEMCGMILITYFQFDDLISYSKRVKEGIEFGSK